tara:strand:+ start:245 stop:817 length:573 start_codon:yes stop_codon:yes gene_type:complete
MSEIQVNKISPATGTAITLGDSGDTFTIPSGATITNSGTATGFGGTNAPYFHVNRTSSDQSLSDATFTDAIHNNEVYDSGSCYNTSNGRFTPNVAGYYLIYANPEIYAPSAYSNFVGRLLLNGSTQLARCSHNNSGGGDVVQNNFVQAIQYFNGSSDYVTVNVYVDVPSNTPVLVSSDGKNYFGGYKLTT